MSESTSRLALTLPGGGSTGTITPPDPVDIDVLNTNFRKIDDAVGVKTVTSTSRPPTPFDGQLIRETDTGDIRIYNATTAVWDQLSGSPVGDIRMWPKAAIPAGFLVCDGAEVSRTVYQALYAVIGTTFGAGNDTTTFNLPDLSGRSPVGVGKVKGKYKGPQTGVSTAQSTLTLPSVTNLEFYNGQAVRVSSTGALPGGLSAGTTYYIGVQAPGVFRFYNNRADVRTGTHIPLTSQGTASAILTIELVDDFTAALARPYGASAYQLRPGELPAHGHGGRWINQVQNDGTGNRWAVASGVGYSDGADGFIGATGADSTHGNLPPSLALNFIIRAEA